MIGYTAAEFNLANTFHSASNREQHHSITASSDKSLVKAMQPIVNEMDQDTYE